jgi:SAM-dependent methyltransferase
MSHHHADHHDHHDHAAAAGLPDILDLDAEVLADVSRTVNAEIERLADSSVRTILDLGAGTGTGTIGLLGHFTDAHVTAVDASADMLEHLGRRTHDLGLSDRVTAVQADLDETVPAIEPVDLAWASASMHHLADPDRTLARLVPVIRPGGLLAVVELAGFPRFVPDGTPGGSAEARAHQLLAADRVTDMPTMGDDWAVRLERAGLTVEAQHTIEVDMAAPLPAAAGRYAAAALAGFRNHVADRLEAADREAFDSLLDGGVHDVRRRTDLHVTTTRWMWIARR